MARISIQQAESMTGNGGQKCNYFSLKNDKERATVRMLYNDINDVAFESVHEVPNGNCNIKVACLREAGDSADACPLCKSGNRAKLKLYIPIYNESEKDDTKKYQIWERGQRFVSDLSIMMSRMDTPISGTPIEITRYGASGAKDTKYDMWSDNRHSDGKTVDNFDIPNPHGSAIKDWDYDTMSNFVGNTKKDDEAEPTIRRRNIDY